MKVGAVLLIDAAARFGPLRKMALDMEAAELDSVWVYDHLLVRRPGLPTGGLWESWTMLTGLAAATERVNVGTLVACTQFRNPALLAQMAVTLDEVSNGRLILGLGAGWHQPEFEALGIPFDHRASRFAEAIGILKPLLRDGYVDFQGRYVSANNCELVPKGPRASGPPLLLAGVGPRMLDIVAQHADMWNTAWHGEPSTATQRLQQIRDVCKRRGRDPNTLDISVAVSVVYADLGGRPTKSAYLTANVADALRGYAELGVSHVIVELSPLTKPALDRFVGEVARFRAGERA
jgi:probable F420-dependent oxidoreductase